MEGVELFSVLLWGHTGAGQRWGSCLAPLKHLPEHSGSLVGLVPGLFWKLLNEARLASRADVILWEGMAVSWTSGQSWERLNPT